MKSVDENSFSIIDQKTAYWIGLIAADGYISKNGQKEISVFGLGLQKSDIEHIKLLRNFLQSDHKICEYKNSASLRICNRKLISDLIKWGIEERKSHSDKSLIRKIPHNYRNSFICGLFDGDGGVFIYEQKPRTYKGKDYELKKYTRITLDSNKSTLEDVDSFLKEIINLTN